MQIGPVLVYEHWQVHCSWSVWVWGSAAVGNDSLVGSAACGLVDFRGARLRLLSGRSLLIWSSFELNTEGLEIRQGCRLGVFGQTLQGVLIDD